ncbi:MAG: DNA polymerase III subunit delta' [Deltaproteobacteria bacterium]|nr:DNA polymerase III subunit delta' [Deltaproteobacteria bacterium]MBW1951910.1 DNA polymerase III subunit delta' [Deltaproteobacteria bacterium]MBW1986342.1 DNA polymerase III subunit delta' [Deltaproteobacteria bacterium]MBW2134384.1 DNA polymerase III subunit delta' [Deltaproteobacteria bacterium]
MFFRDILGQERPLNFLKTALRTGQMPHAYLFLGGKGVGKASTAQALAQALNCEQRQKDQEACGQCASCRRFAGGNHPDFVVLSPLSDRVGAQIKIEQIRELRRQLGFPPLVGPWRVTLIKPAEALNEPAANALLKLLEEPPSGNLLILAALAETDLLPTIVSRCRRLSFLPLPPALVVQELIKRRSLEPDQAALVAALSGGSLGLALAVKFQDVVAQRDQAVAFLEKLPHCTTAEILDWAAGWTKNSSELETFLLLVRLWYRDLLALHFQVPPARLINQDRLAELNQAQGQITPGILLKRLEALNRAQRQLQANLNVELTLDILGLQLQSPRLEGTGKS